MCSHGGACSGFGGEIEEIRDGLQYRLHISLVKVSSRSASTIPLTELVDG